MVGEEFLIHSEWKHLIVSVSMVLDSTGVGREGTNRSVKVWCDQDSRNFVDIITVRVGKGINW